MTWEEDRRSGIDTRSEENREETGERRDGDDRRKPRKAASDEVRLTCRDYMLSMHGQLKNISKTGALIKVEDGFLIPDEIFVHAVSEGYKIPCVVTRRDTDRIGIQFSGAVTRIGNSGFEDEDLSAVFSAAIGMDTRSAATPASSSKKTAFGKLGRK